MMYFPIKYTKLEIKTQDPVRGFRHRSVQIQVFPRHTGVSGQLLTSALRTYVIKEE